MKGFFYSNQSLVIVLGSVLFLVVLYFIIKALPTKVSKKQAKEEKKEEKKQEPEKVEIKEEVVEEKTQEEEKKDKKADKKPKIVQVYKRESRVKEDSGESKKALDPIYDRNVEFVNTSKNIAKFKSFADETKEESTPTDEFGFVEDVQEDCEFCESGTKHFDHSRRLSKAIREDNFDNMFDSHLSEKYMNINSNRHLNLSADFDKKLFERTEQMMHNSDCKCPSCESGAETEKPKFSLFSDNSAEVNDEEFEDDNVEINMKTALLSEVYFGKRKKTNNKK